MRRDESREERQARACRARTESHIAAMRASALPITAKDRARHADMVRAKALVQELAGAMRLAKQRAHTRELEKIIGRVMAEEGLAPRSKRVRSVGAPKLYHSETMQSRVRPTMLPPLRRRPR